MHATDKFQAEQYLSNGGLLASFMPHRQRFALLEGILVSEEGDYFVQKVLEIAKVIRNMPHTYQTDGQGEGAVVHLHYFGGPVDAWVTEKDMGTAKDNLQLQAFGKITLTGNKDDAEYGYISIQELIENDIELDLYWTPKSLKEC